MSASKTVRKAGKTLTKAPRQALKHGAKQVRKMPTPTDLASAQRKLVASGLEKALKTQEPLARKEVERLRRLHPTDSPKQICKRIERTYLAAITMTGGAAGGVGAVSGVGVPAALADVLAFTEATTLYVLAMAEIHGLDPDDLERRKLLVITVMLGETGVGALEKAVPRTASHWARLIVEKIPMSTITKVNKVLGPRFVTKYGTQQGVLVLSKQVPMGIGMVLGAGGNHTLGRLTIRSARSIFGPPAAEWADPVPPSPPLNPAEP